MRKWIFIAIALLSSLLVWYFIGQTIKQRKENKTIYAPILQKGQQEKILIDFREKKVTTIKQKTASNGITEKKFSDISTSTRYTQGKVSVIEDDKGHLSVKVQTRGFSFSPGLSFGYYPLLPESRLGMDIQWYFIGHFSITVGGSGQTHGQVLPRAYLGITYTPGWKLAPNTALLVGIDNKKDIFLGIRLPL